MSESLARMLQRIRAEKGLSLREAAEVTGVNKDAISLLERGVHKPWPRTCFKLAQGYGVPAQDLLDIREMGEEEHVIRPGKPYPEEMEELLGVHDPVLHEADVADRVARAALRRYEIESEWAAKTDSSQKLHLAYRLLSANNHLNIALKEYKRIMGEGE